MKRAPAICCCFTLAAFLAAAMPRVVSAQSTAPAGTIDPAGPDPDKEREADMRLPKLDRSGLLPDLRKPETVTEDERNPFGAAAKVFEQITSAESDTEERRIQRVLNNLRISGVSESASGRRVLLGPFSLGEGDRLPKLFAGQVEELVVKSVGERGIILQFVEPENSKNNRSPIGLAYDLRPPDPPSSLLVGEMFIKAVPTDEDGTVMLPPLENPAVRNLVEGAESNDLRALVERRTQLIDAPAAAPSNDEKAP